MYLYIMGASSGAGKSSVCLGILAHLIGQGHDPARLAYIKPVTQCIKRQAVGFFCRREGIACRDTGSLVFQHGLSQKFIAGETKSSQVFLGEVLAEIHAHGSGKDTVLIDGIGDPSTGSVVGVSNRDVAAALACPVLFVGKPGIGAAIDNTVLCEAFLRAGKVEISGLLYNRIPPLRLAKIRESVSQRLESLFPKTRILGFLPENEQLLQSGDLVGVDSINQWFSSQVDTHQLDQILRRADSR